MDSRNRALAAGGAILALAIAVALFILWPESRPDAALPGPVKVAGIDADAGEDGPRRASSKQSPGDPNADAGHKAGPKDPSVLAHLGWGAGPDQLGHDLPQEGNPEGPMSFAFDKAGRALLLDTVNGRVLRLNADGTPDKAIPVSVRAPQDIQSTADGKMVVMDRLSDRSVAIMDSEGTLLGELPLEGQGIDEGGAVTGIFVDGDDVYAEREHGPLVRLGDTSGKPDAERPEIPGRPSRDGKLYLNAGLSDALAGRVYVNAIERATQKHLYTREYRLTVPLVGILLLDTDLAGTIYLGLLAELPRANAAEEPKHAVRLLCLAPADGAPLGQVELPATDRPEESFRDFAVLDEGGVVYALRTEQGVTYQRADCR